MKITAVGDMIIQKRIYEGYEGFAELATFIRQGDARFFNLETTLNHEGEACASQFSGGTWLRTNPEVLEDIKPFGFNMTSFNNNHALDFSYAGLERTLEALEKSGLVHSGVGRNLAEASAPRYLETKNGRVALIAVNSSFEPSMMAGEQSPRVSGRPGINGIRIEKHIELPQAELDFIKRIAVETNINAGKEITRREGYHPELKNDEAELGELKFVLGETPRFVMKVNGKDMARVEKAIYEAKLQADYIMISVHSHQISGTAKECPIFYSLGDFVLQLYDIELAPADFFERNGLTSASTVHELLRKRSKDFTRGLMTDPRMFRSVIPCWETEGTKLTSIKLLPIEMAMEGNRSAIGLPRRSDNPEIAEYLAEMCEPYGTKITREKDGTLTCTW